MRGGNLFICDRGNHKIRKIDPQGNVTTFAGTEQPGSTGGPLAMATFDQPDQIATNGQGSTKQDISMAQIETTS